LAVFLPFQAEEVIHQVDAKDLVARVVIVNDYHVPMYYARRRIIIYAIVEIRGVVLQKAT
jgi:hypothetical protein